MNLSKNSFEVVVQDISGIEEIAVGQIEFLPDGFQQHAENLAVEEVECGN